MILYSTGKSIIPVKYDTSRPTLTAKAIYRLSDGLSYAKADEEAAGFAAETGTKWYEQV